MKPGAYKARKEASKRLGLALERDYRELVLASGPDEIQAAAIALGHTFNTNVEFCINVLKAYGGLEVKFEPLTRPKESAPANDPSPALPAVPAIFRAGCDVDMPRKK